MKSLNKIILGAIVLLMISLTSVSCVSSEVITSENDTEQPTQAIGKDEVEDPDDRGN